ncbi:MAG: hypothetical protein C4520_18805 [Candidatus Abyssobacteria bacterium SURF_5]|uniref:Fibronectin type-III domain-containing protein n=1 Tax=Abyssobacteria bacterium (strain SURF_5) TaxID=2093360 RepID=A0A3A4N1U2_ABYX5|nr:MAG: hypothetical protein C4520_18805 [Candidatus Abyssubacteria bacterium SURF_5]
MYLIRSTVLVFLAVFSVICSQAPAKEALAAPAAPSDLQAQPDVNGIVHLSWTDNSTDEDGFCVYRNGTRIKDLPANTTTHDDNKFLSAGTEYCYFITAYNSSGESPASNEACILREVMEIYVDDDVACPGSGTSAEPYCQIQTAIDNAWYQDEIVVRDGTYTSGGTVIDKPLVIRSENGPANCVVDGAGFSFNRWDLTYYDERLDGFTITNSAGTGIFCGRDGAISISNCIITGHSGLGIRVLSEVAFNLENCVVAGNQDSGIELELCGAWIDNCSITGNSSPSGGGGIATWLASLNIRNSTVADNSATGMGGGIFSYHSGISLNDCTISGNFSHDNGGGLYIEGGLPPDLTNVVISGNTALRQAGALSILEAGELIITHSTIAANSSGAGGTLALEQTPATITNSIFWDNSSGINLVNNSALAVYCSDIENGAAGISVGPGCSLDWGGGNIAEEPLLSEDHHLACLSPCVDACSEAGVYIDMDGDNRPQEEGFDMGADEYIPLALTEIDLQSPANGAIATSPPTFCWSATGGCNNGFSVDVALSPLGPIYSTYEHLHQIIRESCWTMPPTIWNMIPPGRLYWRVRGADLEDSPPVIVTSEEVRSLTK